MATHETIWTTCGYCSTEFGQPNDPGRKRQYCSDACKQAAYRFRKRRAEQARRAQQEEQARRAREETGRQRARAHQPPPHAGTSRPGTSRSGTWCAGCGGTRAPHTHHHDQAAHERAWRRYQGLLRKAASTTFPAEADACRGKAEQLRAKYGL